MPAKNGYLTITTSEPSSVIEHLQISRVRRGKRPLQQRSINHHTNQKAANAGPSVSSKTPWQCWQGKGNTEPACMLSFLNRQTKFQDTVKLAVCICWKVQMSFYWLFKVGSVRRKSGKRLASTEEKNKINCLMLKYQNVKVYQYKTRSSGVATLMNEN